jgi:hypothetical protein
MSRNKSRREKSLARSLPELETKRLISSGGSLAMVMSMEAWQSGESLAELRCLDFTPPFSSSEFAT